MNKLRLKIIQFVILCQCLLYSIGFVFSEADQDTPKQAAAEPPASQSDGQVEGKSKQAIESGFADKKPLITINTSVDKAKITVGDKIVYKIEVFSSKNIKIEFPQFGESLGGFAITDYKQEGPDQYKDGIKWRREYYLDVYIPEKYIIPPARLTYQLDNGDVKEIFTAPLFITVDSILSTDAKLIDIKPVIIPEYKISKKMVLVTLILLIILSLAVFFIIFWYKKKHNYTPPPKPAHLIALEALENLKQKRLVEAGKAKEFYFLVSNILRHYIENRFGIMAPEMTTEEFLAELKNTASFEYSHKQVLSDFLTHCDMVKFAKYSPDSKEADSVYDTAVDFVRQTKPAEPATEEQQSDEHDDDEE